MGLVSLEGVERRIESRNEDTFKAGRERLGLGFMDLGDKSSPVLAG